MEGEAHEPMAGPLLDDQFVQRPLIAAPGGTHGDGAEREAVLDRDRSVEERGEQRRRVVGLDLREEPQAPDLHAEDGAAGARREVRRPEERPIAPDGDDQIEVRGEGARARGVVGVGPFVDGNRRASIAEQLGQGRGDLRRLGAMRMDEETDRGHAAPTMRSASAIASSRAIVAPASPTRA